MSAGQTQVRVRNCQGPGALPNESQGTRSNRPFGEAGSVSIGGVRLCGPICLAPLAGLTNRTFRLVCRGFGASLAVTEMVSARGLVEGGERTRSYLDFSSDEHPISVQLFGSEPGVLAEAARIARALGPDIIDLNCGCPVRKVVRQNAGAALLREPRKLGEIVSAMAMAVDVPVTVKMRTGWDTPDQVAEIARIIEASGAAAIAVHGRTRRAGYSGDADWEAIRRAREAVTIPVVGNGDVRDPEAAKQMVDLTGCHMVMVGRWAIGNPWIFRRAEQYLASGELPPGPDPAERIDQAIRHLDLSVRLNGPRKGVFQMRRHLAAYVKGMRGAVACRRELMTAEDPSRVELVLHRFLAERQDIDREGEGQ